MTKRSYWTSKRLTILGIIVVAATAITVAIINGVFSKKGKAGLTKNEQGIISPSIDTGVQNNTQIQQTNNNKGDVNNDFISGNKKTVNNDNRRTEIKFSDTSKKVQIIGKNINTGTNNGTIGDTYTGIVQRHVTQSDIMEIIKYIPIKITPIQFNIVNNGGEEAEKYATEIADKLLSMEYIHISAYLSTAMGDMFHNRNWGISKVAGDTTGTITINIMPASNINKQ